MSANYPANAAKNSHRLSWLVQWATVLCTATIGACANVTPHFPLPEVQAVSLIDKEGQFASPDGKGQGKMMWTLYAW